MTNCYSYQLSLNSHQRAIRCFVKVAPLSSVRRHLLPGNSFHSWCCDHTKSSSCPSRSAKETAWFRFFEPFSGNITTFNILQSISWFINEVNLINHHQPNIPFTKSPNYPTHIPNISHKSQTYLMNPENYLINPEKHLRIPQTDSSPNRTW